MNLFKTHASIIEDYSSYIRSFISIADPDISQVVDRALNTGKLWPEPLLQFNPSFDMFGGLEELIASKMLHEAWIFNASICKTLSGEKPRGQ